MDNITTAPARLSQAAGVPGILAAAHETFEEILAVLRRHAEGAGHAFPAFVLAAGAAADGRDRIAGAPSLPTSAPMLSLPAAPGARGGAPDGNVTAAVAGEVTEASHALAATLATAARAASDLADQAACARAAACAARISDVLAGARQP